MSFTEDRVILLKYKQADVAAQVPEYDRYTLENVMVRETFAADADAVNEGGAVVYFLENVSVCRAESGESVPMPRLAKGDRCILHFNGGTDAEVTMRVAEAGYFTGGGLAHVRMKLK